MFCFARRYRRVLGSYSMIVKGILNEAKRFDLSTP
jgi:hypothetical protein